MNKCVNCIHSDICKIFDCQGISDKSPCSFFKDQNKFIELPCKVGDTVYDMKYGEVNALGKYEDVGLYPEEVEQLQKENAELKARLEKSVELPYKVGSEVYVTVNGKRFMPAKLYGKGEDGAFLVFVRVSEHKHIYDWFRKIYTKEEAEQALKGGADDGNDN